MARTLEKVARNLEKVKRIVDAKEIDCDKVASIPHTILPLIPCTNPPGFEEALVNASIIPYGEMHFRGQV